MCLNIIKVITHVRKPSDSTLSCLYQLEDKSMVLWFQVPDLAKSSTWTDHSIVFTSWENLAKGSLCLTMWQIHVCLLILISLSFFETKAASCQLSISLHRIKSMLLRLTFRYDQTMAYKDPPSMGWKQRWFSLKWPGITFLMAKVWMWWLELEQPHWVWWRKMGHEEGGETRQRELGLSLLWAITAACITSLDCSKKEKYKYFVFSVTCSWICISIEASWESRWEVIRWNFYSFCHCLIFFFITNQHLIEHCMKDSAGWSGIILKDRVGSRHHKQSSIVKKSFWKIAPALLYKCSSTWSEP